MAPTFTDDTEYRAQSQEGGQPKDMPSSNSGVMPIAVIGMACRFPGEGDNVDGFWTMIREGRDAWSEFPKTRMNAEAFSHPSSARTGSVGLLSLGNAPMLTLINSSTPEEHISSEKIWACLTPPSLTSAQMKQRWPSYRSLTLAQLMYQSHRGRRLHSSPYCLS